MTDTANLRTASWSVEHATAALHALARASGLSSGVAEMPETLRPGSADVARIEEVVVRGAAWLGLEAEPLETAYPDVEKLIALSSPALLRIELQGEVRLVALLGAVGNRAVSVLGEDLGARSVSLATGS